VFDHEELAMNWDISIGNCRQFGGRALQVFGRQVDRRGLVLRGAQIEYRGRLQTRYGWLKHQEQWGVALVRIPRRTQPANAAEARMPPKRAR
jgi:uncharacterized protein YjbJ (UPF0337 family)